MHQATWSSVAAACAGCVRAQTVGKQQLRALLLPVCELHTDASRPFASAVADPPPGSLGVRLSGRAFDRVRVARAGARGRRARARRAQPRAECARNAVRVRRVQ